MTVHKLAERAAEDCAPFGQPWVAFEFRSAHAVKLPLAISDKRRTVKPRKSWR